MRRSSRATRRVGQSFAALILTLSALVVFPTAADARPRTYVTSDCYHARTRPDSIIFACGDGGYYIKSLDWTTWRVRTAVGRGSFRQNDCDPNCAEGTFRRARGVLTLSGRLWCPDIERYVFRKAKAEYDHKLNGQTTERFRLFCPL